MSTRNDQSESLVRQPSADEVHERAKARLPRWDGKQYVSGYYYSSEQLSDWPDQVASLRTALWRGHELELGWDGQEVWLEPSKAKAMNEGEACALLLLQKTRGIGGIKPKASYFTLLDKARPHLDEVNGGLFPGSYGSLRSEELDQLCAKHKALVKIQKMKKGVVAVFGFPNDVSDACVKAMLEGDVINYFRFKPQPNKQGMAIAQMEYSKAKAICAKSSEQWDAGTPLRIETNPVRIEWGRNQDAFDHKPKKRK